MSRENDLRLLVFTELREAEIKKEDKSLEEGKRLRYGTLARTLRRLVVMSGYIYDYQDWRKQYDTEGKESEKN